MKISNLILKYLIFELIPQYVYLTKIIQLKHVLNLNYCLFTYKLDFMYLTKLRLSTAKKQNKKLMAEVTLACLCCFGIKHARMACVGVCVAGDQDRHALGAGVASGIGIVLTLLLSLPVNAFF